MSPTTRACALFAVSTLAVVAIFAAFKPNTRPSALRSRSGPREKGIGLEIFQEGISMFADVVFTETSVRIWKPKQCYESHACGLGCRSEFTKVEEENCWDMCCPENIEESDCYTTWNVDKPCYAGYELVQESVSEFLGVRSGFKQCCPPAHCFKADVCYEQCDSGTTNVTRELANGPYNPANEFSLCGDICCPPNACYWDDLCFSSCGIGYFPTPAQTNVTESDATVDQRAAGQADDSSCVDLCCPFAWDPDGVVSDERVRARVCVNGAKDLPAVDWTGAPEAFALVAVYGNPQYCRTETVDNTDRPVWEHCCDFVSLPRGSAAAIVVYDQDNTGVEVIGKADFTIDPAAAGEMDLPLQAPSEHVDWDLAAARVRVTLSFEEA